EAEREIRALRARRKLDTLADRLAPLVRTETKCRTGPLADEIALEAVASGASIVVMGLRKSGLRSQRGTVAYRVTTLSAVPVLVVPPRMPREASEESRAHADHEIDTVVS